MGRPRTDPSDSFLSSELAIAGGTTQRNVQLLRDNGLLSAAGDTAELKRMAFAGALSAVGLPLLAAGRLAAALTFDPRSGDGEFRSGMEFAAVRLPAKFAAAAAGDYWAHRAVSDAADAGAFTYERGAALRGDTVIEIADRRDVFIGNFGLVGADHIAVIDGWGADLRVKAWFDLPEPSEEERKLAEMRRTNSVGLARINVALAIRNAFDAVRDHRAARLK